MMNAYEMLLAIWLLVTVVLFAMLVLRSRLTRQETDWIDLTNDEREERAIEKQTNIEKQAQKFTWPIRGLSVISLVLLLATLSVWAYHGINTQPPAP